VNFFLKHSVVVTALAIAHTIGLAVALFTSIVGKRTFYPLWQQQQVCTTFSAIFFFLFTQFLITFICVSKKFKRRGTKKQLPPRA